MNILRSQKKLNVLDSEIIILLNNKFDGGKVRIINSQNITSKGS